MFPNAYLAKMFACVAQYPLPSLYRSSWSTKMSRVMMWCGRVGKTVPTGIDLPFGSPLTGHAEQKFICVGCGHAHACRNLFFEEDGPTEVDKHWFALDLLPDVAAEVGVLVSMFAMIEFYIPWYFQSLTGIDSGDAMMVMGYFKSFGDKIELLQLIIGNRTAETKQTKELTASCRN
jgi:hypothetical protein